MFPLFLYMSQAILKFDGGGEFVYWGPNKYSFSELEQGVMNTNLDKYLSDRGITGENADEVRQYVNSYMEGLKKGTIKRRIDGAYDVYDNNLLTDDKKVKRNWLGKIKGDKKQIALDFYNKVFDKMLPYEEKKEESKDDDKELFGYNFGKRLKLDIFKDNNSSDLEKEIWYSNDNKWDVALNSLNKYRESLTGDYDFSNTPFENMDEYLSKLSTVETALKNKDLSGLKQSLYDIGESDLIDLFRNLQQYKYSLLSDEEKRKIDQVKEIEKQKAEAKNGEIEKQEIVPELGNMRNFFVEKKPTMLEEALDPSKIDISPENFAEPTSDLFLNYNPNNVGKFSETLAKLLRNSNNVLDNGFIKNSITTRHGVPTVWKWIPEENRVEELLLKDVDPDLYKMWEKSVKKNEKGGVLKAQEGLDLNGQFAKRHVKKEYPTLNNEKIEKLKDYNWSDADIARAIGTVSDILSMGSAYFGGYGTVASAVLGLTGTASNLYGDIRDPNVSAWDTAKNAGIGIGADLVGVVPGLGGGAKSSKIAKNLSKLTPALVGAISGINLLGEYDDALDALDNLRNTGKLSKDEMFSIARAIQSLTGLSNSGVSLYKDRAKRKAFEKVTNNYKTISADGTEIPVTEQQYNQIMNAEKSKRGEVFNQLLGKEAPKKIKFTNKPSYTVDVSKTVDGVKHKADKFSNDWLFEKMYSFPFKMKSHSKPWGYSPVPSEKNGGILKAQMGTAIGTDIGVKEPKNIDYSNIIGATRLGFTELFNALSKFDAKPVLTSAPTLNAKVLYNTSAEHAYKNAANKYRQLGANMVTADSDKNTAYRLAAESKAQEQELKGKLTNIDAYQTSLKNANDIANTNAMRYAENAAANLSRMRSVQAAKEAFNRAKWTKAGQNISNYLLELQQNFKNKYALNQEIDNQLNQQAENIAMRNEYDKAYAELARAKDVFVKANPDSTWESSEEYKRAMDRFNNYLNQAYYDSRTRMLNRARKSYFKSGGTLTYSERKALQDASDYNKQLRQSQKELNSLIKLSLEQNNKIIRGLSNYSATLIKNSLKV